jgi:hypothetical protein
VLPRTLAQVRLVADAFTSSPEHLVKATKQAEDITASIITLLTNSDKLSQLHDAAAFVLPSTDVLDKLLKGLMRTELAAYLQVGAISQTAV